MNKKEVKRFSVDDVYVSVLKADIIKHKNGWIHVREKEKMFKPTGSVLMDIVGQVLLEYNSLSAKGLAESVGADAAALAGTFRWLTGMTLHEFLIQYRMKQVCEWLTCTDITGIVRKTMPNFTNGNRGRTASVPSPRASVFVVPG